MIRNSEVLANTTDGSLLRLRVVTGWTYLLNLEEWLGSRRGGYMEEDKAPVPGFPVALMCVVFAGATSQEQVDVNVGFRSQHWLDRSKVMF